VVLLRVATECTVIHTNMKVWAEGNEFCRFDNFTNYFAYFFFLAFVCIFLLLLKRPLSLGRAKKQELMMLLLLSFVAKKGMIFCLCVRPKKEFSTNENELTCDLATRKMNLRSNAIPRHKKNKNTK
jgi:hypothetical protein